MNKEAILKVLEPCQGLCDGVLADDLKVLSCINGELLWATGEFTRIQLRDMDNGLKVPDIDTSNEDSWGDDYSPDTHSLEWKARALLATVYGMKDSDIMRLMAENDRFGGNAVARRDHMIQWVKDYAY